MKYAVLTYLILLGMIAGLMGIAIGVVELSKVIGIVPAMIVFFTGFPAIAVAVGYKLGMITPDMFGKES